MKLEDRIAVVSGAAQGIGCGIARLFANEGARVMILDINIETGSRTASSIANAEFIHCDVASKTAIDTSVESIIGRHRQIDVCVNNAGILRSGDVLDISEQDFDEVLGVNLKGAFLCAREVYPHMVKCGGGKIINIGSMTSTFGLDFASVYAASKGGIVQLAKSQSLAWAKDNIQVNCILPGWIKTELTSRLQFNNPERYSLINKRIPAGRWGEPNDFAGIAVFLASSASDYVTGIAIPIDGGYTAF